MVFVEKKMHRTEENDQENMFLECSRMFDFHAHDPPKKTHRGGTKEIKGGNQHESRQFTTLLTESILKC
jgi:hypothetical protein